MATTRMVHLWRKIVRAEQVDAWSEQIARLVDPRHLAVVNSASSRSYRLEVYCQSRRQALGLVVTFGGQVREIAPSRWQPLPATVPGRPLSIGGRLLVTSRESELASLRAQNLDRCVLCIPAAMAFGTGEHATTAMCLRLLLKVAQRRRTDAWDLLDLGTGSGILALAGKGFGARRTLGVDHDPHAVRTARQNARLNDLTSRAVRFEQADLLAQPRATFPPCQVVTANLFSELLIRLLPPVIAPAVAPGGDLILSGVLASQADEVIAAVRLTGLALITMKNRGRWRAFHCRKEVTRT